MSIVRNGFIALLLWLCAAPAFADVANQELIYRVNLGRADDVLILLDQGGEPNQTDEKYVPLLHLAAQRTDEEGPAVVKALLDAGADINGIDAEKQTALFYAARRGNVKTIELLLEQGINYYAMDKTGAIARTVAHNAGHSDIVDMLDKFVKEETREVRQRYEDLNYETQQRQKAEREQLLKAYDEQQKIIQKALTQQQKQAAKQAAPPPVHDQYSAEQEEIKAKEQEAISPDSDEYRAAMQELSLHSCLLQYWSYVQAVKQSSELSADEVQLAIESHKEKVKSDMVRMGKELQVGQKALDRVSTNAKKHMFTLLENMESNTYRREQGIGKMDDASKRCELIARNWDTPAADPRPKKTSVSAPPVTPLHYNPRGSGNTVAPAPTQGAKQPKNKQPKVKQPKAGKSKDKPYAPPPGVVQ